jgi:hypothetical protein
LTNKGLLHFAKRGQLKGKSSQLFSRGQGLGRVFYLFLCFSPEEAVVF